MPLELFVLVGAFLEEIVSPIPSFLVLIPAGAAAQVQGSGWWYLLVLALIAAVGRVLASSVLYILADKAEDWLLGKHRRLFGISHKQMEAFGKRFSGGRRDWWVLFAFNAVPVLPTSFLSVASGLIKIRFDRFVTATFVGTTINATVYLSLGYIGFQAAAHLGDLELTFQIVTLVLLLAGLIWFLWHRLHKRV